jgi:hypothetical protein
MAARLVQPPRRRALSPAAAAEVDEYGELARRLALCDPDQARLRVLSAKIQMRHEHDQGDEPVVERGQVYEVQMTPRRHERTIYNKKKAFEALRAALGLDGLIAILDIPVTAIDKVIPRSRQKAFVHEERSGYRILTVVALSPAAAKAPNGAA